MKLNKNSFVFAALAALLSVGACKLWAQDGALELPTNAYKKTYGNGWDCKRGYKKTNDTCTAIKIPANAYLSSYGSDWKCNRGFLKNNGECKAVLVPNNAYLLDTQYGQGWECVRDTGLTKTVLEKLNRTALKSRCPKMLS